MGRKPHSASTPFVSNQPARFSPFRDSRADVATYYAAESIEGALAESVLRFASAGSVVPASAFAHRVMATVKTTVPLPVLTLFGGHERRLPPAVTRHQLEFASPALYAFTQAWARCFYRALPRLAGIRYLSHQWGGETCVVLFKPRLPKGAWRSLAERGLDDPMIQATITEMTARSGISVLPADAS